MTNAEHYNNLLSADMKDIILLKELTEWIKEIEGRRIQREQKIYSARQALIMEMNLLSSKDTNKSAHI